MSSRDLQQAITATRERLYPSVGNPNWLVLRKRREIFTRWMNRLPSGKLLVLDVGGRLQPYRELLSSRPHRYTSVDIRQSPLVDVVAAGEQLPFAPESFDLVICAQVLEYVPEPQTVLSEIYRILRRGGTVILSVPAAHPRDADEECWSFHPAGIRKLLGSYSEVKVVPEGGSILGLFRTINACLNIFARSSAVRFLFTLTIFPILNLLGLCLETIAGSANDQFTVNYSATARKSNECDEAENLDPL